MAGEPPELTDGDLLLRHWRDDDVCALFDARQDPELARWLAGSPWPYTMEDARRVIVASREELQNGRVRSYPIVDAAGGELLGAMMLRPPAEVGYWLKRDARGRGVATRALLLLAHWLLEERGDELLELMSHPDNVASQRVAERAGFKRDGTVDEYATWGDGCRTAVRYVLRRADLNGRVHS